MCGPGLSRAAIVHRSLDEDIAELQSPVAGSLAGGQKERDTSAAPLAHRHRAPRWDGERATSHRPKHRHPHNTFTTRNGARREQRGGAAHVCLSPAHGKSGHPDSGRRSDVPRAGELKPMDARTRPREGESAAEESERTGPTPSPQTPLRSRRENDVLSSFASFPKVEQEKLFCISSNKDKRSDGTS